jgi:hypothetical protein
VFKPGKLALAGNENPNHLNIQIAQVLPGLLNPPIEPRDTHVYRDT